MPMPNLFDPQPLAPERQPPAQAREPHGRRSREPRSGPKMLWLAGAAALIAWGLAGSQAARAAEFTVQVGAFEKRPSATFAEAASRHGEMHIATGDDGITRVSIGKFASREDAASALTRLKNAGYPDAFVAPYLGQGSIRQLRDSAASPPAARPPAAQAGTTASADATPPASSSDAPAPAPAPAATPAPAAAAPSSTGTAATASSTPAGRPANQNGRFRLLTHDTQSGQTKDLIIGGPATGPTVRRTPPPVVAGRGVSEVPDHLRAKLVYLDGAPYIKEGERFIPLAEALTEQ